MRAGLAPVSSSGPLDPAQRHADDQNCPVGGVGGVDETVKRNQEEAKAEEGVTASIHGALRSKRTYVRMMGPYTSGTGLPEA